MTPEDACVMVWKGYKAGKGAGKKRPNGSGTCHCGKGPDEWPIGRKDGGKKGGKKGSPRVANDDDDKDRPGMADDDASVSQAVTGVVTSLDTEHSLRGSVTCHKTVQISSSHR